MQQFRESKDGEEEVKSQDSEVSSEGEESSADKQDSDEGDKLTPAAKAALLQKIFD